MFSKEEVCLSIIILIFTVTTVQCDCEINFPPESTQMPTFYRYVGTHKLKLNTSNRLTLEEKQLFEAHCDNGFEMPSGNEISKLLYIRCIKNYIYVDTEVFLNETPNHIPNHIHIPVFECASLKWRWYESMVNFDWCPSNATSYILAAPNQRDSTIFTIDKYLGGVCYDIYMNSFHSIFHTWSHNKTENTQVEVLEDYPLYPSEMQLEYTKKRNSFSEIFYMDVQIRNWIHNIKYDLSSIIQNKKLYGVLNNDFSSLFELLWWENLRLYNWNYYINALATHIETDRRTYDLLAGISDSVKLPIRKPCDKMYTLQEVVYNVNRKIPLYIWNYLQDRTNSSNDIVIIGINSPFLDIYSREELIFCTDRCQEVPWLKDVSSSFHYNIMGVIFCCRFEDVRSSKRLYGFPDNVIKSKAVKIREQQSEPVTEITTEVYDE